MKQGWRIAIAILFGLLLQACGPHFETRYSYAPPPTDAGKLCATQCQNVKTYCRRTCAAEEDSCKAQQQSRAHRDYENYVRQQQAAQREIKRSPSSFMSYGTCSTYGCSESCDSDFRICYSTCGGHVSETVVCTSGCEGVQPVQPIQQAPRAAPPVQEQRDMQTESLCRRGAKVEVYSEGDWYRATVKGPLLRNGLCPVHYIGYDESEDEDVPLSDIRRIGR